MTEITAFSSDENTRRYYLDVMGIQCWESIDSQQGEDSVSVSSVEDSNREVAAVDYSETDYSQLEQSIQQCTKCTLHKTRKQALPGRGSQSAELMFVVLSPDAADDASGVICGGEGNALFSKMLAAIDINIDDVYISSLLKCNVPLNHTVSPKEIQICNDHLKQQIKFIQPKLLIVLGETAVRCFLQKDLSIDDYRVMNNDLPHQLESVPVFVSYSPAELLLQPENKRKAWADLQQLQTIIDKPQ